MLLESFYKRAAAKLDQPSEASVGGAVAASVMSSVMSTVLGVPAGGVAGAAVRAAVRAGAAVPLQMPPPMSEEVERGFATRWAVGARMPSFLFCETCLRRCEPSPVADLWQRRRRRARPRRAPRVALPLVKEFPREEDLPVKTLSSHILLKAAAGPGDGRRRSSTRRPTGSLALARARPQVRKGAYRFPTHSLYQGEWSGGLHNFDGQGNYLAPHKVEYEGEFQDGMCHGSGAIHYPNGAVIRGTWERGRLLQPAYIASDGLNFDPDGPYCMMPDRRFYTEIQQGLRPAGRSQLSNAHPPRPVPPGCYDAGDGIFDPRRNCIYDPDTLEVVRVPTKDQMQWIKENCRKGWDENVGFRPELYENWWVESPPSSVSVEEEAEEEEEEEEAEEEEERAGEEEGEEEGWLAEEGSVRLEPTMEERFDAEFEEEPLPAHVAEHYPPIAVQDVVLDATAAEDIYPFLFPETEEEGATVLEKLMVPVDTEVTQENLRMRQRYLNALEADRAAMEAREHMEKKREEEEMAAKAKEAAEKAKVESPPATPRLSLDETEEVYKGPWRHVARRLVPMLRQRLETDRKTAAKKWQDDLVRLLTERDTKAGLEMSTSGYLGAAESVAALSKPRGSRVIIPPGLEERARQRRAEREEREREVEEKRQAEAMAKQAAKEQGLRAAEAGSDSDEEADREPAPEPGSESDVGDEEVPEMLRRRPSVLPTSAQATPKGGRMSLIPEDRTPSKSVSASAKKSLSFKPDSELEG